MRCVNLQGTTYIKGQIWMEKVKHILFYTCNCNTRIKFTVMKEPQNGKV